MADVSMQTQASRRTFWIRVIQIAWLAVVPLFLALHLIGYVVYFGQLREICTAPIEQCRTLELATAAGAEQLAQAGLSLDAYALLLFGYRLVMGIVPIVLGVLIFVRRCDNLMALLVSFFLVTWSLSGEPVGLMEQTIPAVAIFFALIKLLSSVLLPLFFGLFPNGRMVPRIYWAVVVLFVGARFANVIFGNGDAVTDPLWSTLSWVSWLGVLVGGTAAQIYRYRRVSNADEKKQTRWVLSGLVIFIVWLFGAFALAAASGDPTIGTDRDPNLVRRVAFLIYLNTGFEFIYLSIGLAVLRSRLFDIDLIIRRTLVYGALTALLVLLFFAGVTALQQLFVRLTGQQSEIAVVVSTLVIAAIALPLRNRIQSIIDRRFYRKNYNAQQALVAFSARLQLQDEADVNGIAREVDAVMRQTLQPRSVKIMLAQPADATKP